MSALAGCFVLPLESADLFAGQAELLGDGVLGDVLLTRGQDRPAEVVAGAFNERAGVSLGLFVRLAGGNDVGHRVGHSLMVSRVGIPP